jgi:hypothetical protein
MVLVVAIGVVGWRSDAASGEAPPAEFQMAAANNG